MIKTMPFLGVPGDSYRVASTDAAQSVSSSVLEDAGRTLQGLILSVDTNPVRIAFSTAPTQGASGIGHTLQKDQDPIILHGANLCEDLQFISATASTHGGLQITPLYST